MSTYICTNQNTLEVQHAWSWPVGIISWERKPRYHQTSLVLSNIVQCPFSYVDLTVSVHTVKVILCEYTLYK